MRWNGQLAFWSRLLGSDASLSRRIVRLVLAHHHAVLGDERPDVQRQRLVADDSDVPVCLLWRGLYRDMRADLDEMHGLERRDLRLHRLLAIHSDLPDGLQLRFVWLLYLRCGPVQRPPGAVLQQLGAMDHHGDVPLRLQRRKLHRFMLAGLHPVLRADGPGVQHEWHLGQHGALSLRVLSRSLHWSLLSRRSPMLGDHAAAVRLHGLLADAAGLPLRVLGRFMRGSLRPGQHEMLHLYARRGRDL